MSYRYDVCAQIETFEYDRTADDAARATLGSAGDGRAARLQ